MIIPSLLSAEAQAPCITHHRKLTSGDVLLSDHSAITSSASTETTLAKCMVHCGDTTPVAIYYNTAGLCQCEPNLRMHSYMDGLQNNTIKRVFTNPNEMYLCK